MVLEPEESFNGKAHPRLLDLMMKARASALGKEHALALVYPCDRLAMDAAQHMRASGMVRPVLIGPRQLIEQAADQASVDWSHFELIDTGTLPQDAARQATTLARNQNVQSIMKGSLHTDELMSAVVNKETGLRTNCRISHTFLFDLPQCHKLLALTDCVVNISPDLRAKQDILTNAVGFLQKLGIAEPKVGIVAAVETVNPAIVATLDAKALVDMSRAGSWPGALVEGPLGFDNAISAQAARIKKIESKLAGDADLLLMPDLNAGNMLYKSLIYIGGADCAGLVLGASVPIVLTSRADSLQSRLASVALAVLTS
ncbi:MAG: bifunctional enoyl-CoA hydratase/phosphate acetyltransferase [Burkholderiales bacterium]|nr:bifunctional enoyl-CoA hydratase/phosphate acetyltransferase [Burkholderiales bacterium]